MHLRPNGRDNPPNRQTHTFAVQNLVLDTSKGLFKHHSFGSGRATITA
jgi:hypothetical protein